MKFSRRAAFVTLLLALVVVLALGFYRAAVHKEPRPDSGPTVTTPAPR